MSMMKRVPIAEQAPEERVKSFKEACPGYTEEEMRVEAPHCLNCKNPRCVAGCPVPISIPVFLQQVIAGQEARAAGIIAESSVPPTACDRVCPQKAWCEGVCIRGIKSEPVAIGKSEHYMTGWTRGRKLEPESHSEKNGQRVAVIGVEPARLICAGDLTKLSHEVEIPEALYEPGDVLIYGIPKFRLPEDTAVAHEVENVKKLDVGIKIDTVVGKSVSVDDLLDEEGYDATFIGSGVGPSTFMHIPDETANGVFSANEFSTRDNLTKAFREDYDTPIFAGRYTTVVGDGNVAMDAARAVLRLSAEMHIVYRRSGAEPPACAEEVHHAREKGVIFDLLTNPVEILQGESGWVRGVHVIYMEFGEPDRSGRRRPAEISSPEEEIPADTVIMTLSTLSNPLLPSTTEGLETNRKGYLIADEKNGQTTREGVFAGGNTVIGATTMILAMGAGKQAVRSINEYLRSKWA